MNISLHFLSIVQSLYSFVYSMNWDQRMDFLLIRCTKKVIDMYVDVHPFTINDRRQGWNAHRLVSIHEQSEISQKRMILNRLQHFQQTYRWIFNYIIILLVCVTMRRQMLLLWKFVYLFWKSSSLSCRLNDHIHVNIFPCSCWLTLNMIKASRVRWQERKMLII